MNAATPTPLKPDGSLDGESASCLCRRWLEVGLDGVLLLGSMGEGPLLADAVRDAFVETALERVGAKLTIFVSAADTTRAKMEERARRYAVMGASCVMLCLPPGDDPAAAVEDVKRVADRCPAPCAYYEIPSYSGIALTLGEMLDLISHPNILALKDSSNSPLIAQGLTSPEYRVPGVALLDGVEYRTALSASIGYDGVLHGGGVLTARRVRAIWEMARGGFWREALELDRRNSLSLGAIYNRFSRPLQNIVGQKYALELLGVFGCAATVSGQSLDDSSRRRIAAALARDREWFGCGP